MENRNHSHDACCKSPAEIAVCPRCGQKGRRVGGVTLDRHLPAPLRAKLGTSAGFCTNPACEAVYFDGTSIVLSGETSLPVTQKDQGEDVFVCYCFEHKRGDIRRNLQSKGTTDVLERIKKGIQEGRCDCERKNPQGACCLGNVAAAIKQIGKQVKDHAKSKS